MLKVFLTNGAALIVVCFASGLPANWTNPRRGEVCPEHVHRMFPMQKA